MSESASGVDSILPRYRLLQDYVEWSEDDARRLKAAAPGLEPALPDLVEDFYREILRHASTRQVISGGEEQLTRLKGTLHIWLMDLLNGPYDEEYVSRRYRVGWRHVEIGLPAVYTNVALSRIRTRLTQRLLRTWTGTSDELVLTLSALQKRLDLDLALIEEAYQAEHAIRLQRAERLITLGQVAGGIAHELRNPLNVIQASAFYLRSARNLTPEKQLEHFQRIQRNVELADSVITALSNFARMPIPRLLPLNLNEVVHEALEHEAISSSIELEVDVPRELPTVMGDADQLRIVVGNLIRNARDAMPRGGKLSVRAAQRPGRVDLVVTDTGIGIPPEQLHRVMDPLFSTKARGLGLGLSIARSILEKSEGSLEVSSIPGEGSSFTVTLKTSAPGGA